MKFQSGLLIRCLKCKGFKMEHIVNTKFYEFLQNNSGGYFVDGYVIFVEATNENEANQKAQDEFDVYFNGCDSGVDCSCCGDRWHETSEYDVFDFKQFIGDDIEENFNNLIDIFVESQYEYCNQYMDDPHYDYIIKNYNETSGTNYNVEEFVRSVKMFWGINCYVLTYDNQKIKFDGYGIVYE